MNGHLVVPGGAGAPDEESDAAGCRLPEAGSRVMRIDMNGQANRRAVVLKEVKQNRYFPDEMAGNGGRR